MSLANFARWVAALNIPNRSQARADAHEEARALIQAVPAASLTPEDIVAMRAPQSIPAASLTTAEVNSIKNPTVIPAASLTTAEVDSLKAMIVASSVVAASRNSAATDNGKTLELAAGITYTLLDSVALPLGVTIFGPAAGNAASIAVAGSATINGAVAPVAVAAGSVFTVLPRPSSATSFIVKGA